uniref:Uncharacterized protein n=1 Tax=Anguilla anguilla TaxID=7936 RepID=A0A0E9U1I9_ANGAN
MGHVHTQCTWPMQKE